MNDRAERRRQEREDRRRAAIIVGDGIVATGIGHRYEAIPRAQLPDKEPGKHRWFAVASYVVTPETAATAFDPEKIKFLDQENLFMLAVGCWDCEEQLGTIEADSRCPAPAAPS